MIIVIKVELDYVVSCVCLFPGKVKGKGKERKKEGASWQQMFGSTYYKPL